MAGAAVEVCLTLTRDVAEQLRRAAQARGVTEEIVVRQALDLFFRLDEVPPLQDYWFSVAAMREDWDAMPEDWMAADDEVNDAVPAR